MEPEINFNIKLNVSDFKIYVHNSLSVVVVGFLGKGGSGRRCFSSLLLEMLPSISTGLVLPQRHSLLASLHAVVLEKQLLLSLAKTN